MTSNDWTKSGKTSIRASLTVSDPWDPPNIKTTGTPSSNLKKSLAPSGDTAFNSLRTGFPVRAVFPSGKYLPASEKEIAIFSENFDAQRFTLPGTESDSWITTGIRKNLAANSVGKLAYPPLPKTTSG